MFFVSTHKTNTAHCFCLQNYKRVIEVWFDDKFKEYFYTREPLARFLDMGDISEQLAMKERLKCRSFQWFMDNVAYDMREKYPELPPNLHWGEVRLVLVKRGSSTHNHTLSYLVDQLSSCYQSSNEK